ncbi:hypothetical protein BD289DRAFT_271467 [Coniella lustricola]|uniref:Uncharacterized protein n=1 Tax=Coniella lustricola TaxID=2025994 RepID=A0A2T3AKF7_9PEZI|nr:hypothetical protein BD289DRAFT_271467 [Coniella lustricola]
MFESSVGSATEELTQLFHRFERASTESPQLLRPNRKSKLRNSLRQLKKDEHETFDPLLDIRTETSLLTEVRDIRDELNILNMVLSSQLFTLSDFRGCLIDELSVVVGGSGGGGNGYHGRNNKATSPFVMDIRKRTLDQERRLKVHKRDIDVMDEQAERLYKSLTDLLDLKQKHSNALEARFASEQALAAAKEGQTIMVFTIVTIIFMPMSFIAAYFGISIDTWSDGLSSSYVATWTFGGGLGISAVFILMAFLVADIVKAIESGFSSMKRHLRRGAHHRQQVQIISHQQQRRTAAKSRGIDIMNASYGGMPLSRDNKSNDTVVWRGGMDDVDGTGRKIYREYSKASGVSALSRTLSHISSSGKRGAYVDDDIELGATGTAASGERSTYLEP